MEYTYAIKAAEPQLAAKTLMQVKKLTGLSLAEIKERTACGAPLFECACADEEGMELILKMYDMFSSGGVQAVFLDCGEPEPIQYLHNALEAYREIDAQEYD